MKKDSFLDFVLDQLSDISGLRSRKMFGGYGIYSEEKFFAFISDGVLYFKTTPETRIRYEKLGSGPFRPSPKQTLKNYYEVREEVLENREMFLEWARESIAIV